MSVEFTQQKNVVDSLTKLGGFLNRNHCPLHTNLSLVDWLILHIKRTLVGDNGLIKRLTALNNLPNGTWNIL